MHPFEAQAIEIVQQVELFGTVDFVDGKEHRLMGATQQIGQFLVPREEPVPSGDHENDPVRLFNSA